MKGFTLIELLAVIVILAIILIIAIPTINSIVEGAKIKAFELDTRSIISSVEKVSVLDADFSYDKVSVSNIQDYANTNKNNYSQILIEKKADEIYVNIVGDAGWDGLIACGTKKQLFINEPDKCNAIVGSTCKPLSKDEILAKISEGYIPIANANDLNNIRQIENGDVFAQGTIFEFVVPGVDGFDGIPTNLFIQVGDIDLSEYDEIGFEPIQLPPSGEIGFSTNPKDEIIKNNSQNSIVQVADETITDFVYDGNCNSIEKMTIRSGVESTGKTGLFREIPTKGTVKNLNIIDAYVTSNSSEGENIGILAGETESLVTLSKINISGVISTGAYASVGGIVSYSNFSNFSEVSFNGEIYAPNSNYVGGIVGYGFKLNFIKVHSNAEITGNTKVGGLIGGLDAGEISDSYYQGSNIANYSSGGIIGSVYGGTVTIRNSYAYASTHANNTDAGGLLGKVAPSATLNVENSYYSDDDENGFGKKLSDIGFKNITKFVNWDFEDTWYMGENYPLHRVTGLETNYNHGDLTEYTDASCFTFDSEYGVITGYDESCGTDVAIPSQINGVTVVGIMEDSPVYCYDENNDEFIQPKFYNNDGTYDYCYINFNNLPFRAKSLTSVILPNTLQFIGEGSFYENQLTEVKIPNSVKYIGVDAFSHNFIEQGNFIVDNYANEITIEDGITRNGPSGYDRITPTFLRFLELTEACFEFDSANGVITGYNKACPTDIIIPSTIGGVNVLGIGYDSPLECYSGGKGSVIQPKYYLNKGDYVECNPTDVERFFEEDYVVTSVVLPNTLKFIMDGVFYGNEISELVIPNSLEYLSGFETNKIANLTIPSNVKYIGTRAFDSNLLTNLNLNSGLIQIGKDAFSGNLLTSLSIPNTVIKIGQSAFSYNDLNDLTLGTSLKVIDKYAFSGNELTEVNISNSVTTIGEEAFRENLITNVTFNNSLETIEREAFSINLITEVNIPNSVQVIGASAFYSNRIMQEMFKIDNYNGLVVMDDEIYNNGESGLDLIYPTYLRTLPLTDACFDFNSTYGVITGYNKACPSDVIIPASIASVQVKGIAEDSPVYCSDKDNNETTYYDFHVNYDPNISCYTDANNFPFENRGITSVVLPDGIEFIMEDSFRNNKITTLVVPSSVKYLSGFSNNQISTLTLNEGLLKINGFEYNELTSLYLPNSVINLTGFSHNQISTLRLPPTIQRIEGGAFYYNQLTNIDIPSTVTYLGSWSFGYNQLTSIVVPPNIVTLDGFSGNQLTSVSIPSTVTYLSGFNDNNFTSIVIPNTVRILGVSAFSNNQLTSVTIPNGVTEIERYAFLSNKLTSITIPNSVTKIEYWAFGNNNLVQGSARIDNTYGNILVRPDVFLNQGQYPYYQITPTYLR